ncbi:hypothetical protein [Poseidonibacter ostreae]|uniref:Uncharacterized protein n=1 Tax=Poseidonibacter ostreae TaxID=2654171 RepID=A0A6L4WR03_9BACT|nr:hypothetical protein [Poseidonibacter ostreae]KAB7887431.1 hypothetical protein GBG19_10825 [Poseidonibacter ostreae]
MLSQIENSFLKSEIKVKIQLFILPLLCIYFYFYFFDYKKDSLVFKSTNLNSLISKKFRGSYLELNKDIETFCLSKKININAIDYNKNNLLIKGRTSLDKINKLIVKIEYINNFSKITSLNLEKTAKHNLYNFEINSEFKKYYIKEKIQKVEKKVEEKLKVAKQNLDNFHLKAIISNHILLNNKWYTKNDFIGKYKVLKIEKNLVVLNYKQKNIKIRLNKNE